MKTRNKDNRSTRRALAVATALVLLVAIAVGVTVAFRQLRALWIEQCAITDVNTQVTITTDGRIKADTVRELFGLRNGANLALIDFAEKRAATLKKYPAIKSVSVSRRLPDGVSITVTERDPFARIGFSGSKKDTGRVCDDEGVVFTCRRGAEMLPIIREPEQPGTRPGLRLEERARAALTVLLVAREAEFADLNILEIDTAKPDYLLITLSSYSVIKFRWEGMDKPSPESDAALRKQLACAASAIAANLSGPTRVWNATQPGFITSNSNSPN